MTYRVIKELPLPVKFKLLSTVPKGDTVVNIRAYRGFSSHADDMPYLSQLDLFILLESEM